MIKELNYNGDIHRMLVPLFEYRGYALLQPKLNIELENMGTQNMTETNCGYCRFYPVVSTKGFTSIKICTKVVIFWIYFNALFILSIYQKQVNDVFIHRTKFLIDNNLLYLFTAFSYLSHIIFY